MVKEVPKLIIFRGLIESFVENLFTTVKQSHYPYKFGTCNILNMVYPLEPAIEAYLREEGYVGKMFFQAIEFLLV